MSHDLLCPDPDFPMQPKCNYCDVINAARLSERAQIVAGISHWCATDPVIYLSDPMNPFDYAEGVRFTMARIARGDFRDDAA